MNNEPEDVKRQTQIQEQLNLQDTNISRLEKVSSQLGERLMPASTPPGPTGKDKEDKVALVEIAEQLRDNNERILPAMFKLENMINRLEL